MSKTRTINLMLSKRYASTWGIREAVREFLANIQDEGEPAGYSIEDGVVSLSSTAFPTLSNICIMGSGSKTEKTETIGQFGEGMKLACLTLQRLRRDPKIQTPEGTYTFSLKKANGFDEPTLHAVFDPSQKNESGMLVTFTGTFDRLADELENLICPESIGPVKRFKHQRGMHIWSRGIHVVKNKEKSIRNWNVRSLAMNRDRNIPDSWDLRRAVFFQIQDLLQANTRDTVDFLDDLYKNEECYEWEVLRWFQCPDCSRILKAEFEDRKGKEAVLAEGPQENYNASAVGKVPVKVPSNMEETLSAAGVVKAGDCYAATDLLKEDFECADLTIPHNLAKIFNVNVTYKVSTDLGSPDILGLADQDNNIIWLKAELFSDATQLVEVVIHELAHIISNDRDISEKFERTLCEMAAKLVSVNPGEVYGYATRDISPETFVCSY